MTLRGSQALPANDLDWMRRYLSGERTDDPVLEQVVHGRALVLGAELRKEAYKIVAATWPTSLAAPELARVGVELGSDLGLIAAMPVR